MDFELRGMISASPSERKPLRPYATPTPPSPTFLMSTPYASPTPLPGSTSTLELGGLPTHVSCLRYADRVFLSVTQLGSFGTLVAASSLRTPDGHVEPVTRVLLGERGDDMVIVAALRLLAAIECVGG